MAKNFCTVVPVQNFILSQKAMKFCFEKFGEIWLDDRQCSLHVKLLSMRLTNVCKSAAEIDDSQFYAYSMCQTMTTGFYAEKEFGPVLQRFNHRQNKSRNLEKTVMSCF